MFSFARGKKPSAEALRRALDKSLAIIEFDPTGLVLDVNDNFCAVMGYGREDVIGKRHSMFVDPSFAQSAEYREFWTKLGRGEYDASEYRRLGKNGRLVWIHASYNPVVDSSGKVERIVKVATDTTAAKLRNGEYEAKFNAISLAQAVIEFTPNGEILTANANFLKTVGYSLDEIRGRPHRMFVEPKLAESAEYEAFWAKLRRGEFVADTFRRVGKGGKIVLLQAAYSPILDLGGKVTKVVKFATDISDLNDLASGLAHLAKGDLEQPINKTFQPVFEPIRADFNEAQGRLKAALTEISQSAGTVASAGKEVASASDDLSRRTEQQAASLEQTAAALSTVTDTVKKTADSARKARSAVSDTRGDAETSGQIVRQAVEAMGKIENSSQRIGQIIGVIDEIAFQTNLLALNAGVEAARAGEAGRGFAVVASEVRALAQRSADAAKEIKTLISASSEEVFDGVQLVGKTGESLARIISKVADINTLISEIAAGAEEQSGSLHEVNAAVAHMDEAVQQNAALAEESTAASRSLLQEAEKLSVAIDQFKIGRNVGARAAPSGEIGRPPARAAAPRAPAQPAARSAPKRAAAGGGRTSAGSNDWSEF